MPFEDGAGPPPVPAPAMRAMKPLRLSWGHGVAWVEPIGAMLGPVEFRLPNGTGASPVAVAPWGDDRSARHEALPPMLKRLRGEWPCVPFGAPSAPEGLPQRWRGLPVEGAGADFHGFSSHHVWTLVRDEPGLLCLEIAYPPEHAIAGLRREIRAVPDAPEIELPLDIMARRDCRLPLALHAVFALPSEAGMAELRPGGCAGGWTYPVDAESGVSRLLSDRPFDSLARAPGRDGTIALNRLPLPFDTEEIVQIFEPGGRITLRNHADRYETWIAFDAELVPSALLWISNRGRSACPWASRFTAVGIEPLRGAFDLGP